MRKNIIKDKSFEFAIGTLIRESEYAESKADLIPIFLNFKITNFIHIFVIWQMFMIKRPEVTI